MANDLTVAADGATPVKLSQMQDVGPGSVFSNPQKMQLMGHLAAKFAGSDLVPGTFKGKPENVFTALCMAERAGEDPWVVMQNITIINGTPGWKTQYLIAKGNRSGVFSDRIKWRTDVDGTVEFNGRKDYPNYRVAAYATLQETGEVVEETVTLAMAIADGWATRNAKYKSIPERMLKYRAASALIGFHAPEINLGLAADADIEDGDSEREFRAIDAAPARAQEPPPAIAPPPPAPKPVPAPQPPQAATQPPQAATQAPRQPEAAASAEVAAPMAPEPGQGRPSKKELAEIRAAGAAAFAAGAAADQVPDGYSQTRAAAWKQGWEQAQADAGADADDDTPEVVEAEVVAASAEPAQTEPPPFDLDPPAAADAEQMGADDDAGAEEWDFE